MLSKLKIERYLSDEHVTLGFASFYNDKGLLLAGFQTLELPWLNNQKNISCIPTGSYLCKREMHKRLGRVFRIQPVPNRSGILIHVGNSVSDIEGCIALGTFYNYLLHPTNTSMAKLLNSRAAIHELWNLSSETFFVEIIDRTKKEPV